MAATRPWINHGCMDQHQRHHRPGSPGAGGHILNITSCLVDNANSNVPSVLASLTKGGQQSATGEILHVDGGQSAGR